MMRRIAIAWFVIGLLVFTYSADFNQYAWQVSYSLWDKGKDLLLFYILYRMMPKKVGTKLRPVIWLALVRVLWEIVSCTTGININASLPVSILFITYSFYVLLTTVKNVRN